MWKSFENSLTTSAFYETIFVYGSTEHSGASVTFCTWPVWTKSIFTLRIFVHGSGIKYNRKQSVSSEAETFIQMCRWTLFSRYAFCFRARIIIFVYWHFSCHCISGCSLWRAAPANSVCVVEPLTSSSVWWQISVELKILQRQGSAINPCDNDKDNGIVGWCALSTDKQLATFQRNE